MSCADCAYYDGAQCRERPPVVIVGAGSLVFTVFPQVQATDWCGDWKASQSYVDAKIAQSIAASQPVPPPPPAPSFEPMVEL
jgi:hypothetical protein